MPDSAFWLSVILGLLLSGPGFLLLRVAGESFVALLVGRVLELLFVTLFTPWLVGLTVKRPLAWRPQPYFRRVANWFPATVLASLITTLPLGLLHHRIDMKALTVGLGEYFWPVMIFDGLLSAAIAAIGIAIGVTAWRWQREESEVVPSQSIG